MDAFIALLLFGLAALISAILKRKQAAGEDRESWPGQKEGGRSQESPDRRVSWEEELRRLLEGESPQAPPPPPPLSREPSRPAPLPTPPVVPRTARATPPPMPGRPKTTTPRQPLHTWTSRPKHPEPELAGLRESLSAYEQASQLDDQAKAQLRRAADRLRRHTRNVATVAPSPEVEDALRLFRSPQSLRAAMVASVVLGPPKGME